MRNSHLGAMRSKRESTITHIAQYGHMHISRVSNALYVFSGKHNGILWVLREKDK